MTVQVKIEASVTSPNVLFTLKSTTGFQCRVTSVLELGAEAAQGEKLCASQKPIL